MAAVKKFGIKYPVVLDNDYSTWTAYGNRYWPRKYLIDIGGYIIYDHIGEGAYEETEKKIQAALEERMARLGMENGLIKTIAQPQAIPSPERVTTPEIYFGSSRNVYLGTLFNLIGDWDIQPEYAENKTTGAKITLNYKAKNVYMVASAVEPVNIRILQDGQLVKTITIKNDDLYQLIDDRGYFEHVLEIIIEKPGLRAFTFTFG